MPAALESVVVEVPSVVPGQQIVAAAAATQDFDVAEYLVVEPTSAELVAVAAVEKAVAAVG